MIADPASSSFKANRDVSTVKVENVPPGVTGRDVVELFTNLVGNLKTAEINDNERTVHLTFHSHDTAAKALCMSGYTVRGLPITVTAMSPPPSFRIHTQDKRNDTRRNLYVLGLPFDLSKSELSSIFGCYGTVTHCVILATVDNASRRRGFVVMSSHAEAKLAMDNISRTDIRGSAIDVSWAVVQRSQGFLDGGDRTVALDSSAGSVSPAPGFDLASNQATAVQPPGRSLADITNSPQLFNPFTEATPPSSTLVVSNIPMVLFSHHSDLEPLFFPFGTVKKLDRLPNTQDGLYSVVVVYDSPASAQEAKDSLHGQAYGVHALSVQFVPTKSTGHGAPPTLARSNSNSSASSLNPHASPFVLNYSNSGTFSAPPTCAITNQDSDYFSMSRPVSRGLASPADFSAFLSPNQSYRSLPTSGVPSRSGSAASWESFDSLPDSTPRRSNLMRHISASESFLPWV
ncbi:hypothetical protein OF83DRAFT_822253 [Amylostereum chailletii]|nr:hypothetical protein OF83DRAFT_822253 [Amylostereum chailletii]